MLTILLLCNYNTLYNNVSKLKEKMRTIVLLKDLRVKRVSLIYFST